MHAGFGRGRSETDEGHLARRRAPTLQSGFLARSDNAHVLFHALLSTRRRLKLLKIRSVAVAVAVAVTRAPTSFL